MTIPLYIIAVASLVLVAVRIYDLLHQVRRDTMLASMAEYQQRLVEDQENSTEQAKRHMRAILIASGCSSERADELLDKSPAEILSIVGSAEPEES